MAEIVLFQYPGACSRVTMSALEEIGLDYADRLVNLLAAGQKQPDYLQVNPKGKVPALVLDGQVMTENAAILSFLDRRHGATGLLPHDDDPVLDNQGLVDLAWCSGTIHPIVRQVRNPIRFTKGDTDGVKADGIEKFTHECAAMAARIDDRWWYGDRWSIIDVYLYWAYSTAALGGFALEPYPALLGHAERVRSRPSFQRTLARERDAAAAAGLDLRL